MRSTRWIQLLAVLLALSLVAAACGDDDDGETSAGDTPAADDGGDDGDDGGEVSLDEEVEVAEGAVLPLPDCPSDWDPEAGLTEDTIKIAMSLPESGPVASLAGLDDGMRAWFDQMEPIDGRMIELVSADDAYDPARTLSNTEEFLATEDPFAFTYMIGTPHVLAIRDLLDEECVPLLFNSTGFSAWGDPENYPWTIGGLLSYSTEAEMWCTYIAEELGEGATVAGLFIDNDFGQSYRTGVEACADAGSIDLVETQMHDPAAPDVTDEITTLASSSADVLILGTTGAPCPQAMAALAASSYDPMILMSYTCEVIPSYFSPVDPAGEGVIVARTSKEPSRESDDPAMQAAMAALDAANLDPFTGAYYTGVIYGVTVEQIFRQAGEMEGGLNRVNLMRATWNADTVHPLLVDGGTLKTDGVNDAFLLEAAQLARYVPPAPGEDIGHWENIGDLLDVEGETGAYEE